jgi:hypothetical protein
MHSVVDRSVDCVGGMFAFGQRLVSGALDLLSPGAEPEAPAPADALPVVNLGPIPPAGFASVQARIENATAQWIGDMSIRSTALVGMTGGTIDAAHVLFDPHTVNLPPSASVSVTIRVTVPTNTAVGRYGGFVDTDRWRLGVLSVVVG